MSRLAILPALVLLVLASPRLAADDADAAAAVRLASQQYVASLSRGDREAAAAFWTEQGDLIDCQGRCTKGRALALQSSAGRAAGVGPRLKIDSLRLITPDVAIEDGRTHWNDAAASATSTVRFTAVWIRRDG